MDVFDFFFKKNAKSIKKKRQRFPCSGAKIKSAAIGMKKIEVPHFKKKIG
jgi:hypothetical protein